MCLNIETPNNHHFPFGTNGKVVVLGFPILKHFGVYLYKMHHYLILTLDLAGSGFPRSQIIDEELSSWEYENGISWKKTTKTYHEENEPYHIRSL